MTDNKSVMKVKILKEAGFEESLLAIALNKKKYDRDMYPVSTKLAVAGGGHDKFLEMISVWVDYTTCRSIHQQMDTYRVGVTKSSESTHHMLIEDVLETVINREKILKGLNELGYKINTERLSDGKPPINNTALIIAKLQEPEMIEFFGKPDSPSLFPNMEADTYMKAYNMLKEYSDKYLIGPELIKDTVYAFVKLFVSAFKMNYDKYYAMFEGGDEALTKDMIDTMVNLAMTLEEDRYGKLHKLKRMLPEGFLQRRIMATNYQALKTMLKQRFTDPFVHWQEWCRQIILQVEHPEYFADILEKNHTTVEELKTGYCNGRPYGIKA